MWTDRPAEAYSILRGLLALPEVAAELSRLAREHAIELFGKDKIKAEWTAYLA